MHKAFYGAPGSHLIITGDGISEGAPCSFLFTYDDTKTPVPAVPLMSIAVVWNKNENLPVAEYTATVSVQFETI